MPVKSSAKPASSAKKPPPNAHAQRVPSSDEAIIVRGARAHNLKNIDVTIPRDRLIVITGPSGSGKSSLAFDTIYAEGQRRYVESLSSYARQFLEQMEKPDFDVLEGLSPTISIEQRTTSYNPRSTVGTVTEIHDYLRLLYARIGKLSCYNCGDPIRSQSQQQIVDQILSLAEGTRIAILAPIVRGRKGEYQKEIQQLRARGFVRVRIDGEILDLSQDFSLDRNKKHDIDVFVDRVILKGTHSDDRGRSTPSRVGPSTDTTLERANLSARIGDSVELAMKLGEGMLILQTYGQGRDSAPLETLMSERFSCSNCGISYPTPEPRSFSFNSPMGACPSCEGLGTDPALREPEASGEGDDAPTADLNLRAEEVTPQNAPCAECHGARLRKESLAVRVGDHNIAQLSELSLLELEQFFGALALAPRERLIAERIIKEIQERLGFLNRVGVNYLSLSRTAQTLSGGEAQRIRLATQIGSSLVGVIYVLDEPSIGLHQRDNQRLLDTLVRLRDLGNTVIVVEHDRDTMERADYIVDLGPGAGVEGGRVIAAGTHAEIIANPRGSTGRFLSGQDRIEVPQARRAIDPSRVIRIEGAELNNLKQVSVDFPLGLLIGVSGVSGSGKSSLINDTLYRALAQELYRVKPRELKLRSITGLEHIDKVIDIDQSPIGKTPRSNPATYTGMFGLIRDLFARLPESEIRGYAPGRFSFNTKGGRCEKCEGDGVTKVVMHFLPDVYVRCEVCRGSRYNQDTLSVRYRGKNIADVLAMTGAEALTFFDAIPGIKNKLRVLNDVGLGYLQLGQSATTLSGGEAQRIKLSRELSRRGTGRTLYILDEPSTGLHFEDIRKLIALLQALVSQGNTVIVIEHNLDIIKVCDYLIDLGPEGGRAGGEIIATGTPESVASQARSSTGQFLRAELGRRA